MRRGRLPVLLAPLVPVMPVLIVWSLASRGELLPSYVVPLPSSIWATLVHERHALATHATVTFYEAGLGLLLATAMGTLAGSVFALSHWMARAFMPYAIALQAVPVVAIAPLFVIWLGAGY